MKYIESLYIDGFRGFIDFDLNELKGINILVGDNNTGKTSVLEAINILEYPGEIGHYISVCSKRENKGKLNQYETFINSFYKDNKNSNIKVKIEGKISKKEVGCYIYGEIIKVLKSSAGNKEINAFEGTISQNKTGVVTNAFGVLYIDEETKVLKIDRKNSNSPVNVMRVLPFDHLDKELESTVIKEGKKNEIVQVLKIFDKDIIGFETIKEDNSVKTYIQHKMTGMLPISAYGDGLKKVFYLSSAIIKAKNGILLIDEIETAIHYSALKEVFNWLIDAVDKYNVQLFATTHSLEAVDALLNCAHDRKGKTYMQESIGIITLKKNDNEIIIRKRVMDGLDAYNFREDYDMELR